MKTLLRSLRARPDVVSLVALAAAALAAGTRVPAGVYGVGLVAGAALALHALGIVLVHRSVRILNFAQIPIALTAGLLFRLLVEQRTVLRGVRALCGPCLERDGPLAIDIAYWVSLAVAMAVAVGLSWIVHATAARRFAAVSPLVLTVATVGVAQLLASMQAGLPGLLASQAQRDLGQVPQGIAAPPPIDASFSIAPAVFRLADVLTVTIAAAAAAAIAWFLRRTRRGVAVQAAAENADRASTLGVDVDAARGRVWMIAGALAGAAGILGAMGSPAGPASAVDVALTVRVLGAAVVASLTSLPVTILAAVAFGVFDQTMLWLFDSSAIADGLIAAAVAGVLLLKPAVRSRVEDERAASWRAAGEMKPVPDTLRDLADVRRLRRIGGMALPAVLLALPFVFSPLQTSIATTALVYAMVGWSLLVLSGWAGQISLGQFALAGGGAWVVSIAAGRAGLPMLLALPAGALAAGGIAAAAGVPALKLRGQHLAVTTLAVALVASSLVFSPSELGSVLPDTIGRPSLFGIDLEDGRTFYYATLLVAVAVAAAVAGLRRSRFGRALIATRDNEPAAQSFGIASTRLRLSAFAVSGMIAGLAGGMFAYQQHGLKAASFTPDVGIALFLMTVIGGLGSLAGPALGAAYIAVFQIAGAGPVVQFAATGGGLLALLLIAPGGLAQAAFAVRDTMLRRIARRHGIALGPTGSAEARTPIAPMQTPAGGAPFVPRRYRIGPQWALQPAKERSGDG